MNANALKVVYICSDSAKDRKLLQELQKFMRNYVQANQIVEWHTGFLEAGADRDAVTAERLHSAGIVVLLISVDFLASKERETKVAMARYEQGKTRVIPVLLRACDVTGTPFAQLTMVPKDGRPLYNHTDKDTAFVEVSSAIKQVLRELMNSGPSLYVRPPSKVSVPRDLLILCDRDPQEQRLQHLPAEKDNRPLVYIVHGASNQCLEEYIERVRKDSLPRLLGSQCEIGEYYAPLPENDDYFSVNFQSSVVINFAKRSASPSDVAKIISNNPARILIYSRLYSTRWKSDGFKQLEAFLKFWNSFPKLASGHRLIACLLITHKDNSRSDRTNANRARDFLEQLKRSPNESFSYSTTDGTTLENFSVVVLPELESVRELPATDWIRGSHFRKLCRRHDPKFCNVDKSVEEIETLYSQTPAIPMRELIPELNQIVSNKICKG